MREHLTNKPWRPVKEQVPVPAGMSQMVRLWKKSPPTIPIEARGTASRFWCDQGRLPVGRVLLLNDLKRQRVCPSRRAHRSGIDESESPGLASRARPVASARAPSIGMLYEKSHQGHGDGSGVDGHPRREKILAEEDERRGSLVGWRRRRRALKERSRVRTGRNR